MSWFEARAYRLLERANGIRFPPKTATRRTFGTTILHIDGIEATHR
jgi:hypothetical protein